MIMVLCLMVYSITEWQFWSSLNAKKTTIRDQYKKPTRKPVRSGCISFSGGSDRLTKLLITGWFAEFSDYNPELVDIVHLLRCRVNIDYTEH